MFSANVSFVNHFTTFYSFLSRCLEFKCLGPMRIKMIGLV